MDGGRSTEGEVGQCDSLRPTAVGRNKLNFLGASDIMMVSLISGMTGAGVPSRIYNGMAAGRPIIAISEPNSEIAMVVNEEQIGWVVSPDQPDRLAEVLLEA